MRLAAEQVRDAALSAGGLLADKVGGPSVFPPQPASVTMEAFEADWKESEGEDRHRRGLYTFTRRQAPYAQNVTFDGADPSQICTRRQRSNTPLQALTLLNDPDVRIYRTYWAARYGASPSTMVARGWCRRTRSH